MKKNLLLGSVFVSFVFTLSDVNARPIISVAAGVEQINIEMNQTITLLSPFQNTYVGQHQNTGAVGGLFLGIEKSLFDKLILQLGGSYYTADSAQADGIIFQFSDPTLNDLRYKYQIKSQQLFFDGKLLTTLASQFHPFVTAGIGESWNKAYNYAETSVSPGSLPMTPGFSNHSTSSGASFFGIGLDNDLTASLRLGFMYRRVSLNQTGLGISPQQDTSMTLTNNQLHGNEYLVQLSYLG